MAPTASKLEPENVLSLFYLIPRELKTANNPFEQAPMWCAPAIQKRLVAHSDLIGGDLVSTRVSKFAVHAERVVTLVKQSL